MDLAGKVAVITGGASGIGKGTALAMAQAGAQVVLADVNDWRLQEVRSEIEAGGGQALAVHCDVSDDQSVARLAEVALVECGRVDLLMNNAGVVLRGALEQIETTDWEWCFDINVFGIVRGIRAFLPGMLERGSGYIINTASVAGMFALTGEGAPYIASKFAVVGLSEALALYCRPRGVGVSVLCPSSVATNLAETGRTIGMTAERALAETALAASVQGNREMTPDEVARAVVEGVRENQFLIVPDPGHLPLIIRRAQDLDTYLKTRLENVIPT